MKNVGIGPDALYCQFDGYPEDWGRSNQQNATKRWFVI